MIELAESSLTGVRQFPVKVWKFPTGEVGVKIECDLQSNLDFRLDAELFIHLHWESNDDILALAQLNNILQTEGFRNINLAVPYFPYSRQDRACNPGEAASLKVVAGIINGMNFRQVFTVDPHSYVLENVVDRLAKREQWECVTSLNSTLFDYFIAPDAGAAKKIYQIADVREGRVKVLCADKRRDSTGKIVETTLPNGELLKGKKVCIIDDICDGGATFLALGEVIKQFEPATMSLYITHGFFTKGVEVLNEMFDNIYVKFLFNKSAEGKVVQL